MKTFNITKRLIKWWLYSPFQITTLINHKDKLKKTEKTSRAIQRVGQAVSAAVSRFVAVGEAIALENEELKEEMGHACFEARRAGWTIVNHITHFTTSQTL